MKKYELLYLFINQSNRRRSIPNLKYYDKKLYHYNKLMAEYNDNTHEIIIYNLVILVIQ